MMRKLPDLPKDGGMPRSNWPRAYGKSKGREANGREIGSFDMKACAVLNELERAHGNVLQACWPGKASGGPEEWKQAAWTHLQLDDGDVSIGYSM